MTEPRPPDRPAGDAPPTVIPDEALAELESWLRELEAFDLTGWAPFIPGGWRLERPEP